MLSLLFGLLRLCASLGAFPGCWRLHRKMPDHRFVVTKGDTLLVSFHRAHSPDAHLLLQEEAALDDEHLLDDRDHDGVALVSDRRHRVDLPTYRGPIDLHRVVREQFVDQLLPLVSDSRDLYAARFNNLLCDRNLFGEKRNDGLAGLVRGAVVFGPRWHARFHQYRLYSTSRVVTRSLRCRRGVVPSTSREDYRVQDRGRPAV